MKWIKADLDFDKIKKLSEENDNRAVLTTVKIVEEDDTSITDLKEFDEGASDERIEQFEKGEFSFISIKAVGTIYIPIKNMSGTNFKIQEISSGGLYGIESDIDDESRKQIEQEQVEELVNYLETLNVVVPDEELQTIL